MRIWFSFHNNYYSAFKLGIATDSWGRDNKFKVTVIELVVLNYMLVINYVDDKVAYDKFIADGKLKHAKWRKKVGLPESGN